MFVNGNKMIYPTFVTETVSILESKMIDRKWLVSGFSGVSAVAITNFTFHTACHSLFCPNETANLAVFGSKIY